MEVHFLIRVTRCRFGRENNSPAVLYGNCFSSVNLGIYGGKGFMFSYEVSQSPLHTQ
jgi:hypothetical protein